MSIPQDGFFSKLLDLESCRARHFLIVARHLHHPIPGDAHGHRSGCDRQAAESREQASLARQPLPVRYPSNDQDGGHAVDRLSTDLTFALRTLRRSPLFTLIAVLSLALGIGANTAIFSLLDQLLLRVLPVKDPDALVMLYQRGTNMGGNDFAFYMERTPACFLRVAAREPGGTPLPAHTPQSHAAERPTLSDAHRWMTSAPRPAATAMKAKSSRPL